MTRFIRDRLFPVLDRGERLVLPTEESARSIASSYVLERKRGVLADRVMAFDTFISMLRPQLRDKRKASDIDRLIFASDIVRHEKLRYFMPPDAVPESSMFESFIASMLPRLTDAESMRIYDRDAKHDISLILSRYRHFLDCNGLYEESYLGIDALEADIPSYIVNPSANEREIEFNGREGGNIHVIECDERRGRLLLFPNEKEEIRSVFESIRKLLDDGEGMEGIAITVPGLERLRPYLDKEARLFGIPLDYLSGKSPLEYPAGAYLEGLRDIFSRDFEIGTMKAFFLNPSIPFRDGRLMSSFIASAVRNSISIALDCQEDRYALIPDSEGGDIYRRIRPSVLKLNTTSSTDEMMKCFQYISSVLLSDEQFSENEEDAAAYSFAVNQMRLFIDGVDRCASNGYRLESPVYPLFLSYLSKQLYVPAARVKGIRVYSMGQGAMTAYRHHFLIALNEGEAGTEVRKASFLTDAETERTDVDERDITLRLISSYIAFSENTVLSASKDTYEGFALPLVCLMDDIEEHCVSSDRFLDGKASSVSRLIKNGFVIARDTSLRKRGKDEDFTEGALFPYCDQMPRISFSRIEDYDECPFRYMLDYELGLRNLPEYDIKATDHLEIGNRLHSILERFFHQGCTDPDKDMERLFDEEMKAWREGMHYRNGTLQNGYRCMFTPSATQVARLRSQYLEKMKSVAESILSQSVGIEGGEELKAEKQLDGFVLEGKIDRLARSAESGKLIIYDYKKGKAFTKNVMDRKSLQLGIYKALVDEEVEASCFVFLADGRIMASPSPLERDAAIAKAKEAVEAIKSGVRSAKVDEEVCGKCQMKRVCRRRFTVR